MNLRALALFACLSLFAPTTVVAQEWITFYLRAELPYLEEPLTAEGSWVGYLGTLTFDNGSAGLGPWAISAEDTSFSATIWSGDQFALID